MKPKILSRAALATCLVLVSGSLMGCFGSKKGVCAKPREYQASGSVQSLQVPGDLDEPPKAGLEIPEVPSDVEDEGKQAPTCLDNPPDYFGR